MKRRRTEVRQAIAVPTQLNGAYKKFNYCFQLLTGLPKGQNSLP